MNWINSKIRRVSVFRMALAVAIFLIVVLALAANARYFLNFFKGPFDIPTAQLAAAPDAEALERYWVNLQAEEVMETGIQEITVRKKRGVEQSRSVSASYYVARIGERLLLVKVHEGEGKPPLKLTGYLKPFSSTADRAFFDDPEVKNIRPRFFPMMMDTDDFRSDGLIGLIVAAVFGIGALVFGWLALGRFRDPASHPVLKNMATWGKTEKIAASIESEVKGQVIKLGGYTFTSNFAIRDEFLAFDVKRLDDLLWVYKQVVQNKIYYIIPAGKTFAVCLNWMDQSININGKEAGIDAFLEHLTGQKPWIVFGYSEELAAVYGKKRADLAALVAERHKDVAQASEEQQIF